MKILVLGGTGRTGSLVTGVARAAGHEVTLLVRDPSRVQDPEGLRVLTGDAKDRDDVDRALEGQEGLISTLGSRSVMRSDIAAPAASIFVPIAEAKQARRVIVMSAFGVGATYDQGGFLTRAAFSTLLRSLYRDKTVADDMVRRSALDWTIVHPVTLTDGDGAGRVVTTERLTGTENMKVSRADVANLLVACLTNSEWSRKTVIVTS
jgi:uncharacterized protein YbjT (DUF2867 family)